MAEAALGIGCFVAGALFITTWPRFVRWFDAKMAAESSTLPSPTIIDFTHGGKNVGIPMGYESGTIFDRAGNPLTKPNLPHRRIGIAEQRARAERESLGPVTHQAEVTAKNTKAMESK